MSAEGLLMIGTSGEEWFEDREQLRGHFAVPGLRIEPGDVRGYADGPTGWAVDTPRLVIPDGRFLATRLLAVLHHEDSAWKITAMHFSVGVPDEEALQPPG